MILIIFSLIILLFSVIIHEISHGSVALAMGDPTAKEAGRLSLNPFKHLDPFGSIILPFFLFITTGGAGPIFGWAKPVPINFYNLRDRKWGILKVSVAGPVVNFLLALFFGLINRVLPIASEIKFNIIYSFISNQQEVLFSLLGVSFFAPFFLIFTIISIYNFAWGIFNLMPIPPLDGSHILFTFLPDSWSNVKIFLQQYGLFILLFFIFFGLDFIFQAAIFLDSLISL